jgi:hypothetical protein
MSPVHVLQMSPVHVLQMSPVHVLQMSPVQVLQVQSSPGFTTCQRKHLITQCGLSRAKSWSGILNSSHLFLAPLDAAKIREILKSRQNNLVAE